jgi:hypothetical protein
MGAQRSAGTGDDGTAMIGIDLSGRWRCIYRVVASLNGRLMRIVSVSADFFCGVTSKHIAGQNGAERVSFCFVSTLEEPLSILDSMSLAHVSASFREGSIFDCCGKLRRWI